MTNETPQHPTAIEWQGDVATYSIPWQNGPVREVGRNGIQAPEVLGQVADYLRAVNVAPYESFDTTTAIAHIVSAIELLNHRTAAREARGVEGTSQP